MRTTASPPPVVNESSTSSYVTLSTLACTEPGSRKEDLPVQNLPKIETVEQVREVLLEMAE
jgi:hypothetical protein